MIRSHRSLINLIAGVALFSAFSISTHAQENAAKAKAEEMAALREKAFKLLDTVAGQLTTLQSAENRARMGANVVDSLWKRDEERSRSLLRVVQEDIKTELHKPDLERLDHRRFTVFVKLRQDTVERIAKYDGQAALDFLKVTYPLFEENPPHGFLNNEQALELRLAKQIATNNPDAALKLGRQALEHGFDRELLSVLGKLNRKHKEQAQILYKEIVEKLRDADLTDDWAATQFAQLLVQAYQPPDADALTYREAVGIVVTTALGRGCANKSSEDGMRSEFCEWAATTLIPAEKYDSRIARIKHWATGNYESLRFVFASEEVRELLQEGDFDEVEIIAAKNPEMQVGFYQQAILQAIVSGETEKVRKMIDRFPGDPERRRELLAQLETTENNKQTLTDEQLADIRMRIENMKGPLRVRYLLGVAKQCVANDKKLAMKFLDQAGEAIESMKQGGEQTELRLSVALLYSVLKSDRGFTIMESLVPKLNELVDVAVKLDGYDTNYIRDGEWNMSAGGSVGQILTQLSQRAGDFAWFDFDRAVSLASQFERPEIRMMAQLKLAQSILDGPQRPPVRQWVSYDFR
ncbi:MAG TPA: hypothetical protein VFM63_08730 [Pyrinomonadaceae bacterium]|nr:hypothetical protein [Pyrinomonadaceae bacterium]